MRWWLRRCYSIPRHTVNGHRWFPWGNPSCGQLGQSDSFWDITASLFAPPAEDNPFLPPKYLERRKDNCILVFACDRPIFKNTKHVALSSAARCLSALRREIGCFPVWCPVDGLCAVSVRQYRTARGHVQPASGLLRRVSSGLVPGRLKKPIAPHQKLVQGKPTWPLAAPRARAGEHRTLTTHRPNRPCYGWTATASRRCGLYAAETLSSRRPVPR